MRPIVLCVDDDRNLCQILGKALTSEGYLVRVAHDGEEALAGVREEPPDLVLLDLLLPKRDGFAVLEALRALGGDAAKIPVVLLSGGMRSPQYIEGTPSVAQKWWLVLEVERRASRRLPVTAWHPLANTARQTAALRHRQQTRYPLRCPVRRGNQPWRRMTSNGKLTSNATPTIR